MSTQVLLLFPLVIQLACIFAQNVPPAIIQGPPSGPTYVMSLASYQLTCLATGTPNLRYVWLLNGLTLNMNEYQAKHDPTTGILSFGRPGPQGFFQCTVTNPYGTAISNVTQVVLIVLALNSEKSKDFTYQSTVGQSMQIPCDVSNVVVVPQVVFKWQLVPDRISQQSTDITPDQRVQIDERGTLNIAYVLSSDSQRGYFYRCRLTNVQSNDIELSIAYSQLTVASSAAVPTSLSPMYVTPSPVMGLMGQIAVLRCFFAGGQSISISWTKADGTQIRDGRFTIGMQADSGKLTITNVQLSDQGGYTCTGMQQGLAPITATVDLTVNVAPYFQSVTSGPQDQNVTVGGSTTVPCNAFAIPNPTITWFRNGSPLNVKQLPPKLTVSADTRTLTINNLCKNCHDEGDLGVIQCNASNMYGYVLGQGYINVFEATAITQALVDAPLIYPNPVDFSCAAKTDIATPLTYTWTLNNGPAYDGNMNTTIPGKLHINLTNVNDEGNSFLGTWTCNASNGISSATTSATLYIVGTQASVWQWWSWIPLMIFLLVLLILLIIFCIYCNRGDEYPVDKKERKGGNDPERDLAESGFQDYQRPLVQSRHSSYSMSNN